MKRAKNKAKIVKRVSLDKCVCIVQVFYLEEYRQNTIIPIKELVRIGDPLDLNPPDLNRENL